MAYKHKQNFKTKRQKIQVKNPKKILAKIRLWAIEQGYENIYHLCFKKLGITYQYLWAIVSGRRPPSKRFLEKFRKVTGADFFEIIGVRPSFEDSSNNENKGGT